MQTGRFITVEGQDGAGKSTNVEVIRSFLVKNGIELICTREPGGTKLGERLRELILSCEESEMGDDAELLLMFAARAQHLNELIEPALAAGKWVLCDRFTDATFAYQGGGRGMDMDKIRDLENLVQKSRRPDLTILLDLPVEAGEQRAGERSAPDRFELQKIDFKQRVRNCYLERAKTEPERIFVADASASMSDVAESIRGILLKRFPDVLDERVDFK